MMSAPRVDHLDERALDDLVADASQQMLLLLRDQIDAARRELLARAKQAGPGAAMVGGGAAFAVLATGAGTAALILGLAGRRGASAAAFGVTGAYAGAGALLAREGLARIREAGPAVPEDPAEGEPVRDAGPGSGSAKRQAKSAAKSAAATKSAASSRAKRVSEHKPRSKAASSRGRASSTHTSGRTRRRTS